MSKHQVVDRYTVCRLVFTGDATFMQNYSILLQVSEVLLIDANY